jgi:hypothetical protein
MQRNHIAGEWVAGPDAAHVALDDIRSLDAPLGRDHEPERDSAFEARLALQRFLDEPDLWERLRAAIPPPQLSLDAHVEALLGVYQRARNQPRRPLSHPPVSADRRVRFLQLQRESALSKLIPPGGPR